MKYFLEYQKRYFSLDITQVIVSQYIQLYYINVKLILIINIVLSILITSCKSQKYDKSYKNKKQDFSVLSCSTAVDMFSYYIETINFNLKLLINWFIYCSKFEICSFSSLSDLIYNSNYSVFLNISISHYSISLCLKIIFYLILFKIFLFNLIINYFLTNGVIYILNCLYLKLKPSSVQNSFIIFGKELNCDFLVFFNYLKYL